MPLALSAFPVTCDTERRQDDVTASTDKLIGESSRYLYMIVADPVLNSSMTHTLYIVENEREKLGQAEQPVKGHPLHVECSRYIQVSQLRERFEKQVKIERLCLDIEAFYGERSKSRTFYHVSLQLEVIMRS